ncbi:unnamed protein product [Boreogadus saida]
MKLTPVETEEEEEEEEVVVVESICAAQLMGLGRLAHTVQVLVDLAPTAASHRRASRPDPLGADRLSTAPSFF